MSWVRRLEEAREAFRRRDTAASARAHEPERIRTAAERHAGASGRYLGEMVYGSLDGVITTFAVVSGVAGAQLGPGVVLVLGLANLLGDGLSMAAGAYLSVRSDQDYYRREREREEWEVEHFPDGEREELRAIYRAMGFSEADAEELVRIQTKDRALWVDMMMVHELGLHRETVRPLRAAFATFAAFVAAGTVPLVAYVTGLARPMSSAAMFAWSVAATAATLFGLGAARTFVTGVGWLRGGMEMLAVGGAAATVAYAVGAVLRLLGIAGA
ncbi:MAG: VIT1/CCC1 transporter family protein [Kiritimatiellae bacterium]|nr:VIT1/CCC1 transporter family protein [Kiritimatiellia bacterium]